MRFLHFLYPKHSWVTNPTLSFIELLFPEKNFDTMALADMNKAVELLLKHLHLEVIYVCS